MTLLDNCIAYLQEVNKEEGHGWSEGVIQREAMRMAERLIDARNVYMEHDFDSSPED